MSKDKPQDPIASPDPEEEYSDDPSTFFNQISEGSLSELEDHDTEQEEEQIPSMGEATKKALAEHNITDEQLDAWKAKWPELLVIRTKNGIPVVIRPLSGKDMARIPDPQKIQAKSERARAMLLWRHYVIAGTIYPNKIEELDSLLHRYSSLARFLAEQIVGLSSGVETIEKI